MISIYLTITDYKSMDFTYSTKTQTWINGRSFRLLLSHLLHYRVVSLEVLENE